MNNFFKYICTLGPIGYFSAPGTLASVATVPLIIGLNACGIIIYSVALITIFFGGIFAIQKTSSLFESSDPSEIVIDEVAGMLITFCMIPLTLKTMIVGFALFRLFDISKICGVRWCERFNGPWGIMLDDLWAGMLSNGILHILLAMDII